MTLYSGSDWFIDARRCTAAEVAGSLGFEVKRSHSASHTRCPACGAETRHTKSGDRRGAVGMRHDHAGWHCFQCEESGDGIDFASFVLRNHRWRDLTDDGKREVRRWFERSVGVEQVQLSNASARPAPPGPKCPPLTELRALWRACRRVDADAQVAAYLRSRHIDPAAVAERDLARALSNDADVPPWARSWRGSGHRVIIPLRDALGYGRSVLARSVDPTAPRKSLAPSGFGRAGLVMLCPLGREILRLGVLPARASTGTGLRIAVTEGEIDTLISASLYGVTHFAATLGIVSGSWTSEVAARVPDGAVVVIATDQDSEGERYAAKIMDTLTGRDVALERWRPGMEAAQ